MTSKVFFLVTFVTGLGLAVYSMLHGVERSKALVGRRPSAIFNTPTASAFGIVLGAIGYFLVTRRELGMVVVLITAMLAASLAASGMVALMASWALPYSRIAPDDEAMQGQLAMVISPISASSPGEIAFHADGLRHTLAARSVMGTEIPRDTEVVIDTIKGGIAQVELWSAVEQRL